MAMKRLKDGTYMMTGVTLSYPSLAEPSAPPGATKAKFSAQLMLDDETYAEAEALVGQVLAENFKGKKKPVEQSIALRQTEDGEPFIKANNASRPVLMHQDKTPVAQDQIESVFYPGAIVNAKIELRANTKSGQLSVYSLLHAIQFAKHGTRLAGGMSEEAAAEGFDEVAVETMARGSNDEMFD